MEEERLFRNLSRLTLKRPQAGWAHGDVARLISLACLQELNISNTNLPQLHARDAGILREIQDLVEAAIRAHRDTLEILGILRVIISDDILAAICAGLPRLRKFFFVRSGASFQVRFWVTRMT